jgi:hypothetical protein
LIVLLLQWFCLILLRFDDKWKKSNEAFLLSWKSKILELEQLKYEMIEDSTKHLWLTATISTKTHIAHCPSQAMETEMSIMAIQTGSSSNMLWDGVYNIILAHTKLQDHTKSNISTKIQSNVHEQGRGSGCSAGRGRGGGTGCGGGTGHGPATSTDNSDLVFTTVSSPNMTMKANMMFQPEE